MGTDISMRTERRHPKFGWVCSWHQTREGRDYELFQILKEEGVSGLPADCNACSRAFFETYDTGVWWFSLAELKALVARRPMEDYDLAARFHELIKDISKAKVTANVIGDHEDTDADVRIIYAFWR